MQDFHKAKYTAIISDLHLCEAEPERPNNKLWKKYKTRQFFFDDLFADYLNLIVESAHGEQVELILNGDIFDFDSVITLPKKPPYRITWLEKRRGMHPQEEKSVFKINKILEDHSVWIEALSQFVKKGHRAVFVIGNHDIELHWPSVQEKILQRMKLTPEEKELVRFVEWFYISNGDTLVEHGNQYDPYCVSPDPLHPFVLKFNRMETRLPFGNIACRYMINGMGFFNPHVDTNYLLSVKEYLRFFLKYMLWSQPLVIWTWLWGSMITLWQTVIDHLMPSLKDPLNLEDRIEKIAQKSNATSRMVRELREISVPSAANSPLLIARELWLDRAFIVLAGLLSLFYVFLLIKEFYRISIFWIFAFILPFVPFFLFYARSVYSEVTGYKEPQEWILSLQSLITKVNRVVYGHTHTVRHEIIGNVEHLNSGCWSPAFLDVECTRPIYQKTFIWITPRTDGTRAAQLMIVENGGIRELFRSRMRRPKPVDAVR